MYVDIVTLLNAIQDEANENNKPSHCSKKQAGEMVWWLKALAALPENHFNP